jgi:glycosyltransferase involved in cell wall biosynthesis
MMKTIASRSAIRVLHCIASFSGGGAETRLATLCEAAEERSEQLAFHVAYVEGGPHLARAERTNTKLHPLKARGHHDPRIVRQLSSILREEQIDLVQTWLPMMDVFGGIASLRNGRPLILSECSGESLYRTTWKNALRKQIGRRAAAIVANSVQGLDYWRSHVAPERLHLIGNPIDAPRLQAMPAVNDHDYDAVARGKQLVMYAGRFTEAKNLGRMAEALDRVLTDRTDVNIAMFGEGEQRQVLEDALRKWIPKRVTFMGFSNQLPAWLKRATAIVSLSTVEGSPNIVFEAALLRVPQVLSDIPQHRAAVGEDGAFFCSPASADQAAQAIKSALDHREERERKVAVAYTLAERSDPHEIILQYEELYRRVTTGHV